MTRSQGCPVCGGATATHDVVDFNKSCEENRGKFLPHAGIPIEYHRCDACGFCFAPEMYGWTIGEFARRVYNDDYAEVDPDYLDARPRGNATMLARSFPGVEEGIRHLDYGGGSGLLSALLLDAGWQSVSYDPFVDDDLHLTDFGTFDMITSFEVFEHVPDPRKLAHDIASLLDDEGIVLFSTLTTDGHITPGQPMHWWYASPRNGHISLYTRESLVILGAAEGLKFGSFSAAFHAYWRKLPPWARHLFPDEPV